jgi:hypothetical protein
MDSRSFSDAWCGGILSTKPSENMCLIAGSPGRDSSSCDPPKSLGLMYFVLSVKGQLFAILIIVYAPLHYAKGQRLSIFRKPLLPLARFCGIVNLEAPGSYILE